jgi:hypothetical protein
MNTNAERRAKQASKALDRVWKRGQTVRRDEALRRVNRMMNPNIDDPQAFIDRAMAEAQLTNLLQAGLIVLDVTGDVPVYVRPKDDPSFEPKPRTVEQKWWRPAYDRNRTMEGPDGTQITVAVSYPEQTTTRVFEVPGHGAGYGLP